MCLLSEWLTGHEVVKYSMRGTHNASLHCNSRTTQWTLWNSRHKVNHGLIASYYSLPLLYMRSVFIILIIGLCILLRVYQSIYIYIETSEYQNSSAEYRYEQQRTI
jgi:hypothetical protein